MQITSKMRMTSKTKIWINFSPMPKTCMGSSDIFTIERSMLENTSLSTKGHLLATSNTTLPATPHRLLDPKWPTGS